MVKEKTRELNFQPNYLFYWMSLKFKENRNLADPETGKRKIVKFFNFGGSRSSKTFDTIHFLVAMIKWAREKNESLLIYVFRDTLKNARSLTLADFKDCFKIIGLIEGVDYKLTGDGANQFPIITMEGSTIKFLGLDDGTQAGKCDIVYINEILETQNKDYVEQLIMRCTRLFIGDANPSLTEHFAFNYDKDFNTFYSQTTYLDNDKLDEKIVAGIEARCPWDFSDSKIVEIDKLESTGQCFKRRIWLKPERPDGMTKEMDVENKYRRDNKLNINRGTADRYWWLVYGEGERSVREGAVFRDVNWIEKFPEDGLDYVNFSLDFGYTNDPSVFVKSGVNGNKLYSECLLYQRTATPEVLFDYIYPILLKEYEKRKEFSEKYKIDVDPIVIACDSADKYGDTEFVDQLNNICCLKGIDWMQFDKVKKKRIAERISLMLTFQMYIVRNEDVKKEQQNYVYKYDTKYQKATNSPIDSYNHFWDSLGYSVLHFYLDYIEKYN